MKWVLPSALCVWLLYVRLPYRAAPPSGILFEDAIEKCGIRFVMDNSVTPQKRQIETMLAGVAVFDYDNDGWLDVYFVNGAAIPGLEKTGPRFYNRLYRNNRDGTFTDVTERAGVRGLGYGMGVAAGDYDNDGYEDLFLAGVNHNQLLHNNRDGTLSDVTERARVTGVSAAGKPWSISAGWFDYDNDGWLDLLVVNYVKWSIESEPQCHLSGIRAYCAPDVYTPLANILYHNNGDGTFTDVSVQSGIAAYPGKGMGVAFADYDGDGFTDAFVSNDTYRHFLFRNRGDGTFSEEAVMKGVAYNEAGKSIAGMGCDFRDVDNDGRADIWVVGMVGDTFPLFRNAGRFFRDVTTPAGLSAATREFTAWGSGIADFDNDGYKDLFAARAAILDNEEEIDGLPSKHPCAVFRNIHGKSFEDVSGSAGLLRARRHRGAAFGDLNNDGKIDVVVSVQNELPEILLNRSSGANHWLSMKLVGSKSNRDGLGARIRVTSGSGVQYNHATTSVGFSSSSDHRVHFGLADSALAEKIEIDWPSGAKQTLTGVKADRILEVREP